MKESQSTAELRPTPATGGALQMPPGSALRPDRVSAGAPAGPRSEAPAGTPRRSRPAPILWLLALAPFALLAVFPSIPGPGVRGDDFAQYLMHAQALAQGRPYGDILYLYTSLNPWVGPAVAPPGLPVLLAPVLRFAGLAAVPWFMLSLALLFLALVGRYFVEQDNAWIALGTLLICGLTEAIVYSATQALTDLPFAAAVWGLAIVADRPGAPGVGRLLALTVLGLLAAAMRVTAAALVPALLVVALLRWKNGGWRFLVPVGAWLSLAGVAAAVFNARRMIVVVQLDPLRLLSNARPRYVLPKLIGYGRVVFESQLLELPASTPHLPAHLIATALMVLGGILWLRRRPRSFLTVFAVAYFIMLLLTPVRDDRYFWPILPLLAFGLLSGVQAVAARVTSAGRATAVAMAVALVLAASACVTVSRSPRPGRLQDEPATRDLFAYLRRIGAHERLRVIFAKPRTIAWELKVPAMGTFEAPVELAYQEFCARRMSHLILGGGTLKFEAPLRALVAAHPREFTPVYSNARYRVYRFSGACLSAPGA